MAMNTITKNRLTEIADVVNAEHDELETMLRDSMARAVNIGGLLTEAKKLAGHGNWGGWLKKNCKFSERTAQNYMRVFASYPELAKSATVADLTYREAVALLAEPKQEVLFDTTSSDWLARLEWIEALQAEINFALESETTSPARKMLECAQKLVKQEELQSRVEKYFEVMRGAMIDVTQDEIFPMLEPELRQKVNDWAEANNQ